MLADTNHSFPGTTFSRVVHRHLVKFILILLFFGAFSGCAARTQTVIKQSVFTANYGRIKQIAVQEAANNGFSQLTAEIKPSEYNQWKGRLFFSLKTVAGTDQFFVDFKRTEGGVAVITHGAGFRADPDGAGKAISARLSRL